MPGVVAVQPHGRRGRPQLLPYSAGCPLRMGDLGELIKGEAKLVVIPPVIKQRERLLIGVSEGLPCLVQVSFGAAPDFPATARRAQVHHAPATTAGHTVCRCPQRAAPT